MSVQPMPVRARQVIPASGLAPHETIVLDALVSAGIVPGNSIDRLSTRALAAFVRGVMQALCSDLDVDALLAAARES